VQGLKGKRFINPHYRDRKEKGTTLDFRNKSVLLRPGDSYIDFNGRKYRVAEDGSLRRIQNGGDNEKV
jgi:hypothetical protein